ncbi:MAG: hypothetical protein N3F09_05575 [Bacteroidia bacterium]|nr:hypothetical protein [Bacteroidia bacterium]
MLSGIMKMYPDDVPLFKIRMHGGIPKNVSSRLFLYSFNGEFYGNVQASFYLFSGFYGGIGYQYSQFVNSKEFRDPLKVNLFVRLRSHAASVRISKDLFTSKNSCWVFNFHSGLSYNIYSNRLYLPKDSIIPSPLMVSPFIQPEIIYEWKIEKELVFSAGLGWLWLFDKFNASQSSLDRYYDPNTLKSYNRNAFPMSWIKFSFGCTVYLGKHKN